MGQGQTTHGHMPEGTANTYSTKPLSKKESLKIEKEAAKAIRKSSLRLPSNSSPVLSRKKSPKPSRKLSQKPSPQPSPKLSKDSRKGSRSSLTGDRLSRKNSLLPWKNTSKRDLTISQDNLTETSVEKPLPKPSPQPSPNANRESWKGSRSSLSRDRLSRKNSLLPWKNTSKKDLTRCSQDNLTNGTAVSTDTESARPVEKKTVETAVDKPAEKPAESTTDVSNYLSRRRSSAEQLAEKEERRISFARKLSKTILTKDMANCDPDICVRMLRIPTLQTYAALKRRLDSSGRVWMQGFLDEGGLDALLQHMEMNCKKRVTKFMDALVLLECVMCIRAVLNNKTGLEYFTEHDEQYFGKLVKGEILFDNIAE